jgi:competence ComEA-like helix-hairpin-helix protein
MAKSLIIKLVMLGVVFGGIALMGWPEPDRHQEDTRHLQSQGIQILPPIAKRKSESRESLFSLPQTLESANGPRVDLNLGTLEELMELPGVGKVLGQRIIEYRQTKGPFKSLDELENVSGIGEKRMAQLKPLLTTKSKQKNAT